MANTMTSASPTRFSTGVPGLDLLLGGGIRPGAIVLLVGLPGSGKTILAQQLAHHRAAAGDRVLFLIGISETQDKLIAHSRELSFFDGAHLGREILFGNLIDVLRAGMAETQEAILTMARQHGARLVILDGFAGIWAGLADEPMPGALLHALGNQLALLGATTLVTLEGELHQAQQTPEGTVADAIIGLSRQPDGLVDRRLIEISKVRGSAPRLGRHVLTIDGDGITIYPRLESVATHRPSVWSETLVSIGLPALDVLLDGGLTAGTSTLVAGSPGTGKTLLGLHFLAEGARRQEPGLLLAFSEDVTQLQAKARVFGLDAELGAAEGPVELATIPAYEMDADIIIQRLVVDLAARGIRRLVIDSTTELQRAVDPTRQANLFAALIDLIRGAGITTLFTSDVPTIVGPELSFTHTPLAVLAENQLVLRQAEYRGELHRLLSVLKLRFGQPDTTLQSYRLAPARGFELLGSAPPAEGWLTGLARPLGDVTGDAAREGPGGGGGQTYSATSKDDLVADDGR